MGAGQNLAQNKRSDFRASLGIQGTGALLHTLIEILIQLITDNYRLRVDTHMLALTPIQNDRMAQQIQLNQIEANGVNFS